MKTYSNIEIKKKVNELGMKKIPFFSFYKNCVQRNKFGRKQVYIQNKETKEILLRDFHAIMKGMNPWRSKYTELSKDKELKVNSQGLKSEPQFKFFSDLGVGKHGYFMVEIEHLITGERKKVQYNRILSGTNPWSNKYSLKEVEIYVNQLGEKSSPPFKFVSEDLKRKRGNRIVNIQNLNTGEIKKKEFRMILQGQNPWRNKYSDKEFAQLINNCGKNSYPNYVFVRDTGKMVKGGRVIEIENTVTKERLIRTHGHLVHGQNPWNDSQFKEEVIVSVPLIVRHLRNWGYSVKKEIKLGRGSRIDIVATKTKTQEKFLIEVKKDGKKGKRWSKKKILEQKKRYSAQGKKKYGLFYKGCFLVSPQGLQPGCLSLNELRTILLK